MHGVLEYEGEIYLANLSVEELYATDKENNFKGTSNRLYSFRDIKITPVELLGGQTHTSLRNANKDTLSSVIAITIPQLYELVKTYDKSFFENLNAIGRSDRENEIVAKNEYKKAVEKLKEYTEKEAEASPMGTLFFFCKNSQSDFPYVDKPMTEKPQSDFRKVGVFYLFLYDTMIIGEKIPKKILGQLLDNF